MIFIIDNNTFYRLVVAALELSQTNWSGLTSSQVAWFATHISTETLILLYLFCKHHLLSKANRTRRFNPFSRKLLTVAVGVEWLNRRVRYVIGVIRWASCFIDVSLIEAHNVSRRLNGVPSIPGTPPSMPYPLYPWWALHGRGVLLPESGLSLTAHHLSLPCCPDGVLTLDPEPVTAFFSSTWYGLDGLLERATFHPYFSQQTGGRCCNKSPCIPPLLWRCWSSSRSGMLQLPGRNICSFYSHKPLQPHLPMVLLIPQHMPALLLETTGPCLAGVL